MADRAGFEPALGLTLNTLSRRAPSTTRPPVLNTMFFLTAPRHYPIKLKNSSKDKPQTKPNNKQNAFRASF